MNILQDIKKYLSNVTVTLEELPVDKIAEVVELLEKVRRENRQVFIFGNGGSAATAAHFASDLCKGAICADKARIKAFALTDNVPLITALANDTSYENIFAEQLENYIAPNDVVIAISGSGKSPNVLKGVEVARSRGALSIGFSGFDGGKLKDIVDISIVVPNNNMEQIEDIHLVIEHVITTCLRSVYS